MKKLKILILEDSAYDVVLIKSELKNAGLAFESHVVETKSDYIAALDQFQPEVILSDHSMPQFTSTVALEIYNERKLKIPFILVTGSVSEEFAVQTILSGACDYILKSNLIRLPVAVKNAVAAHHMKLENEISEKRIQRKNTFLNHIVFSQPILLYVANIDDNCRTTFISKNVEDITGYCRADVLGDNTLWRRNIHPDEVEDVVQSFTDKVNDGGGAIEYRWKCANGEYKWFLDNLTIVKDEFGANWVHGSRIDITKSKNADHRKIVFTKGMDEMLYMISHKVRHSISQILGLYYLIAEETVTDDEIKKVVGYMKEPAESLDLFTAELTALMDELKTKNTNLN